MYSLEKQIEVKRAYPDLGWLNTYFFVFFYLALQSFSYLGCDICENLIVRKYLKLLIGKFRYFFDAV